MSENACFTKRAKFEFHAAHDPGTGRRITAATDYWLSLTTPSLRPALIKLRTSSDLIEVSSQTMKLHYADRACDSTGHPRKIETPSAIVAVAPVRKVNEAELRRKAVMAMPIEVALPSRPVEVVSTDPQRIEHAINVVDAINVVVAQVVAALDVTPRCDVTLIEAKQPVELVVTEEPAWVELLRAASADRRWVEVPDDRDAADRNRPGVLMMVASLAQ